MVEQWLAWKTEGLKVDRPVVNFSGTWNNKLGSTMELEVDAHGNVTGMYRTAVGAPGKYEEFPLRGFTNGDLISFVVNWGRYGSMTAWVGQQTADTGGSDERIETLWHLAKNVSERNENNSLWGAFLTGTNTFTRS